MKHRRAIRQSQPGAGDGFVLHADIPADGGVVALHGGDAVGGAGPQSVGRKAVQGADTAEVHRVGQVGGGGFDVEAGGDGDLRRDLVGQHRADVDGPQIGGQAVVAGDGVGWVFGRQPEGRGDGEAGEQLIGDLAGDIEIRQGGIDAGIGAGDAGIGRVAEQCAGAGVAAGERAVRHDAGEAGADLDAGQLGDVGGVVEHAGGVVADRTGAGIGGPLFDGTLFLQFVPGGKCGAAKRGGGCGCEGGGKIPAGTAAHGCWLPSMAIP